jgi:hypothetical protein
MASYNNLRTRHDSEFARLWTRALLILKLAMLLSLTCLGRYFLNFFSKIDWIGVKIVISSSLCGDGQNRIFRPPWIIARSDTHIKPFKSQYLLIRDFAFKELF